MDWTKLFSMQKQLDRYMDTNQEVIEKDLFEAKYFELLVDLGDLHYESLT